MSELTLEGVTKRFEDGTVAVRDVTLTVPDGELMVLVGPSGSGKTTVLRIVAGLEDATEGAVRIGDRLVNDVDPRDRDIAMVFQNYALYPHMTARENMVFALRLRRMARADIDRRLDEAASTLGIGPLLDRTPRQMSGGERQRVALGRALVRKPQVFLFDEPLSNLDAKLRVQMRREIARLHHQLATTMIYVTHDQVEAMTLGDRIAVLNRGELQQVDTPTALYQHPRNTFVASFIGTPPMNLIEGEIIAGAPLRFRTSTGDVELQLDARWTPALDGRPKRRVVLGVRPEDLSVAGSGENARLGVIPARVELVELLGGESLVHASRGGVELTARLPTAIPSNTEEVDLVVSPDRVHLFDRESGERLGS
jgi:multiple sugar transport system ATP-binding protein